MELKNLLLFFMNRAGMNQATLAERSGAKQGTISYMITGKMGARDETIQKIADALKLNERERVELLLAARSFKSPMAHEWSVLDKALHEMGITPPPRSREEAEILALPPEERAKLELPSPEVLPPVVETIPIYSSIACAPDGTADFTGEVVDYLDLHGDFAKGTFGLVAAGDSMNGPESWIRNGEYLLFEPATEIAAGEVGCFCVDGWEAAVCKRFRREPDGSAALISDNPAYPPKIFPPDGPRIRVVGIWAGTFRKPPKRNGFKVAAPAAPFGKKK